MAKANQLNKISEIEAASAGVASTGFQDATDDSRLTGSTRDTVPAEESSLARELRVSKGIFCRPINTLLVFAPLGLICSHVGSSSAVIFGFNFLAIIPLASILGAATESLATHTGQLIGGLLNATFGNAVEMIMCVQAIKKSSPEVDLIGVVQGNLLGSVLSNLLLVLGMAIFASGIKRKEQKFNAEGAAANMTCQVVASISVCLPTMFGKIKTEHFDLQDEVLLISRICSLFLAFLYFLFLVFQLKTHAELFQDLGGEEDDGEEPLSCGVSLGLLAVVTLIVAACSEGLVDSIAEVSENFGLPKAFIGVILLPIVGNAAEHMTAVTSAYKGMMDLALGVAVGSSTQIALFVVPCSVLFGWAYDKDMSLNFRNFDVACQMLTVFLVSQVLQHGNTSWLHGFMLMMTYLLIAIITWFIPEK